MRVESLSRSQSRGPARRERPRRSQSRPGARTREESVRRSQSRASGGGGNGVSWRGARQAGLAAQTPSGLLPPVEHCRRGGARRFARLCVRTILQKKKNSPPEVTERRANAMVGKKVFVTVGTTHFDSLIEVMSSEETLEILHSKGYTSLVLQIGQGHFIPPTHQCRGVALSFFRLKPSIAEDFAAADLVVSHAGAGSCLEALEAGKPLIAVVNNTLMENHQCELAEELSKSELCFCCYPSTVQETLAELDVTRLRAYEPGQPKLVAKYLDSVIKVL